MRVVKFLDIIRSIGGHLRIDNLAGYKDSYVLADLGNNDFVSKDIYLNNLSPLPFPFVYEIPKNTPTPIVINLDNDTIQYGGGSSAILPASLTNYQDNPTILFEIITSSLNTTPKDAAAWISNKLWLDNTYTSLVELTLQPDSTTGAPGGLTLDDINIIFKV